MTIVTNCGEWVMMVHDETATRTFHVDLTGPELRIAQAAVRSFLADFGHDEHEVQDQVRSVLRKLGEPQEVVRRL